MTCVILALLSMLVSMRRKRLTHVWHHDLHSKLGGERLVYGWINLGDHFNHERAVTQITGFLDASGLRSYDLWGLLGEEDLLVKAYVPADFDRELFGYELEQAVRSPHTVISRFFTVSAVLWDRSLRSPVSHSAFCEIVDPEHVGQLYVRGTVPLAKLKMYEERNFVMPVFPDPRDIKFFMRVCVPDLELRTHGQAMELDATLKDAVRKSSRLLPGIGLYKGAGFGSTRYVITGRVVPEKWYRIIDTLSTKVVSADHDMPIKTITYVTSRPTPFARCDELPRDVCAPSSAASPSPKPFAELLKADESGSVEFKGSAFVDMKKWRATRRWPGQVSPVVFDSLVKAVTGFLNARKGGQIVLGVLELGDEFSREDILAMQPKAFFAADVAALGVEHEYKLFKRKQNFDSYQQRLLRGLKDAIDPNPVDAVRIHRESIGDVECVVLEILRPQRWFWAKDSAGKRSVLYVRRGNTTEPLTGREIDDYMEDMGK
jgi:hypothetical protein